MPPTIIRAMQRYTAMIFGEEKYCFVENVYCTSLDKINIEGIKNNGAELQRILLDFCGPINNKPHLIARNKKIKMKKVFKEYMFTAADVPILRRNIIKYVSGTGSATDAKRIRGLLIPSVTTTRERDTLNSFKQVCIANTTTVRTRRIIILKAHSFCVLLIT
jgi:hypothetical protein